MKKIQLVFFCSFICLSYSLETRANEQIPKEIEKLLDHIISLENKSYQRLRFINSTDKLLIKTSNQLFEYYQNKLLNDEDLIKLLKDLNKLNKEIGTSEGGVEYAPENSINGILAVKLNYFVINSIELKNSSSIYDSFVKHQIGDVSHLAGEPINYASLDKVEKKIDEFNGIETSYEIKPIENSEYGRKVTFNVKNKRDPKYYIQIDNHLSTTSGDANFRAGAELQNLLGFGSKYEIDLNLTNQNSQTVALSYQTPTPFWGISTKTDYVYNQSKRDLTFTNGTEEGDFISYSSALSKTFIDNGNLELIGTIGLNGYRDKSDTSIGISIKDAREKIFAETDISYFIEEPFIGDYIYAYTNLRYERGVTLFEDFDTTNSSITNADKDAEIYSYYIHLQNALNDRLDLSTSLSGQYSADHLLSSDLFSIGSKSTVRGFDKILASGESGFVSSTEIDYDYYKDDNYRLNLGLFYDYGKVDVNNNSQITLDDTSAKSWGITSDNRLKLFGDSTTRLELNLGFPIGNYTEPDIPSSHLNFRIKQDF